MQAALDDSIEHARDTISSSHDLLGLQKACTNAFGLYKRTRPPAAPESVARAKGLPKEGMHPLLASKVPVTSGTGLEAQVCCTIVTPHWYKAGMHSEEAQPLLVVMLHVHVHVHVQVHAHVHLHAHVHDTK